AAAGLLAVGAGEDGGDGGGARGGMGDGIRHGGGEFGGDVIIEQAEELGGETGGGFTALESGFEEGLALRHQGGEAAGGRRAEGLAFLFEQRLTVGGIFDELMTIIGAAVRSNFS